MKRENKNKKGNDFVFQRHLKGELAKEVLLMIEDGVIIPATFLMPVAPKALRPLLQTLSRRCRAKRNEVFMRSLSHLNRNRLVSISEKDGQQILTLSEDGRKRVLQFKLDEMVIRRPLKWDSHWRIVIFDIPERKKQGREALRTKLKQLGFHQLQKSCFIHPFDCKAEIDFISEIFEVSPFINFIVAKEIEGTEVLKKVFGLA